MRNLSRFAPRILVAAAVGAAFAALPATGALANPLCGSTITASVTLTADLTCAGDALIVGAAGVTVDLGGYNIIGTGTGTAVRSSSANDVTVTNGGISGFAQGFYGFLSQRQTLSNLHISNGIGIKFLNASDSKVLGTTVTSAQVQVQSSTGVMLSKDTLDHAPLTAFEANTLKVTQSRVRDGAVSIGESNSVKLTTSTFTRAPISYSTVSKNILIQGNTIQGAAEGVRIFASSTGGQILGNTFTGNTIGVRTTVPDLAPVSGTVISGNTFTGNTAAGVLFEVSSTTGGTASVSGNSFIGNGLVGGVNDRLGRPLADGAHFATVAGAAVTVANNLTQDNGRYGIFADPSTVIDGGGNDSTGDPLGCSGVVCI
ncbi:right-handed parallel beta-helix repeat-containing protein [Dactylosporangium darangshiense]|uniref:Periplasmic copper-binding protein NosD beta helix domain-containing protein n=1 Tax=Dactylosporangium darangshiense TaxID=579108 RepID=A0ABP8DE11_9ACTN